MKTKNIFKALAFALLITTACNKTEVSVKKGYELPVTINATRQGDDPATRASYNGTSKKLEFSTGDKLYVSGYNTTVGDYAGILDWQSGGTFSGTIITENEYTGTVDDLFTASSSVYACLLPAGYGTYGFISVIEKNGYDNMIMLDETKAFALTKAIAIEQFSWETGNYVPSNGFELAPLYAILNFTINDLTASTEYAVVASDGSYGRAGNVTTNGSGTATFAVGVWDDTESDNITLTVGGTPITLNLFSGTNTALAAGHVYNVTRSAAPVGPPSGAIDGLFTINAGGDKVYFSQGNLKYSNGTWSFHTNQYDMCFTSEGSVSANYTSSGTFDLFGWGTSGYNNKYPYLTSTNRSDYYEGGIAGTEYDWGVHNTINGGTGWRTLTWAEWDYLLNTRTTTSGLRWHSGSINTVPGIILLPDNWTNPYPAVIFNSMEDFDSDQWTNFLEPTGAVFLPAFGLRAGTNILLEGSVIRSGYWTSTYYNGNPYCVDIYSGAPHQRYDQPVMAGNFVRLVRDAN